MESSGEDDDMLLSLKLLSSCSNTSDSNGETSSAETSSILSDSDAISSDALSTCNDEEEASTSYKTLDSTEETSSSSVSTALEEEDLTGNSSILSDSDSLPTNAFIYYESSDEELFVSTFIRAEFLATYVHQNFSLPAPIMEYISKNPASPEVYQKLIRTCKYFFLKNPILVVPSLSLAYEADGWYAKLDGKKILLNDISSKFWVTDSIFICNFKNQSSRDQNNLSSVTQKIFRCDNKMISVSHQNISFNDLLLLASKCECIRFYSNAVLEDDGSFVPFEKILSSFPLVKDFTYQYADEEMLPQIFTSETVEELIKIPHFATLKKLELTVSHDFDLVRFDEFFKNNKTTKIDLWALHA